MSVYMLGTLEETILIIVLMKEESYGVEIAKVYEAYMKQAISLPAIHIVLKRLEKKGLVRSAFGEPTPERGGKRKKYYRGTSAGYRVVSEIQERRHRMWSMVPKTSLHYGLC